MKKIFKIFLWLIICLSGFLLIAYLALFHLGLIEYITNKIIKGQIEGNLPISAYIGNISGNYYSDLEVRDIYIVYEDSLDRYNMAYIPRMDLNYSLSRFWRGQLSLEKLALDSVRITIKNDPQRGWLVPRPKKSTGGKFDIIDFEIQELAFNNFKVILDYTVDSLIFNDINLAARFQIRENTYSAVIDSFGCRSSDARYNVSSAGGRFTISGNDLLFEDLKFKTDSSEADLEGHLAFGEEFVLNLNLYSNNINLSELSAFIKANLEGNLTAEGNLAATGKGLYFDLWVSGVFMDHSFDSLFSKFRVVDDRITIDTISGLVLNSCLVDGNGWMDLEVKPERYQYVGTVENFNLLGLVPESFPTNLNGMINITGEGLEDESLKLEISTDLNESYLDEYRGHKIMGTVMVMSDSMTIEDQLAVKYGDNVFLVSGRLDYDSSIDMDVSGSFNDLSVFNGQTFIERMGGRGQLTMDVNGHLEDPDITGDFISDSLWIYDIYSRNGDIIFNIDNFLYDREGRVNLSLNDGTAYKIPYDSIYLNLLVDTFRVTIDSSHLVNTYTDAILFGNFDYNIYPQCLTVDTARMMIYGLPVANVGPVTIDVDSNGYDIVRSRLNLSEGYLTAAGRINFDETMSLYVTGQNIAVAPFLDMFDTTYDFSGLLSGNAQIGGKFLAPELEFDGRLDSLFYRRNLVGDIVASFDYYDKYFQIDSVSLIRNQGRYRIQGKFPADMALTEVVDRFPEEIQAIFLTASDKNLNIISTIMVDVDSLIGDFEADFAVSGTPNKPELNGEISIRQGRLKLFELANTLENLYLDITMQDNRMFLDSLSAASTATRDKYRRGSSTASGEIIINSIDEYDYNLDIELLNFPIDYELGDINGQADADLIVRGITPPTVSGDVEIKTLTYRENFSAQGEGWAALTALEGEKSWDLNLRLRIPSNLWIKNDDIDAEFAGDLIIVREKGRYRFIGELEVLRGKGYLADRSFRIEPGSKIYYEDIEYPNPRLDFYASTRVRTSTYNSALDRSEFSNVDLCIHVTGTLDEPIINACPDSPFSTEDILTMIFMNYAPSDSVNARTSQLVGDRFAAGLSGLVSSSLGRIGSRTLGVETFEIDPVYGDKFDPLGTRVTLGFYTHPNLYIYGRSDIAGQAGQEVGFEYRLKRALLLEGRVDEDNLYRLFLNLHWDY